MKQLLTGMCLLLFLAGLAQNKKETIDWINSKIPKNPIIFGDVLKSSQKMKISPEGNFEIIIVDYELPLSSNPKAETTTILKGSFKDFNPASITIRNKGGLIFLDLQCFNSKDCINISQTGKAGISYDKNGLSFGAFSNTEENISERLKKAFAKLITLCGGKKEAF